MPIYLDHEYWDYGTKQGWCVSVEDDDSRPLFRHAVSCSQSEEITPPVYSEPLKVYITALDEIPIDPNHDDEDDEMELVPVEKDEGGYYYMTPRRLITPGVYKRSDKVEMEARAKSQLVKWLEMMRRAGEEIAKCGGQWKERE